MKAWAERKHKEMRSKEENDITAEKQRREQNK